MKYSSYLDELGELRLAKFCSEFDCSKAKAISYLLELWENGTVNDKLISTSNELQSEVEKKITMSLESKFQAQFVTINQQFAEVTQEVVRLKQELKKLSTQHSKLKTSKKI